MFGYASNETNVLMPAAIYAHALTIGEITQNVFTLAAP